MSKTRSVVASLLLTSIWAATAHAAPIPGLFNTGVDNSNVPVADGSVDPHYILFASADPAYPGPNAIIPSVIPSAYWLANSATSKWIAPADAEGYPGGGTPHPEGDYTYRISFDLTGMDPSTALITGSWGVDNAGLIRINGVGVGSSITSYNPLIPFSIGSGFVPGINHLDFVIQNWAAGGSNPTGVRVDGIVGTANATVGVDPMTQPLELSAPFPNPARRLAHFSYTLPRAGMVRLAVVDLAGRTVRTLVESASPAGRFDSSWDGMGTGGSTARAGVYFLDLLAEGKHISRRVVWMP